MKSEDVEKVLEVMHQVKPEELSGDSRKLYNAIMQIADERDKYAQINMDLITFIQNQGLSNIYHRWKKEKDKNAKTV